MRIKKTMAGLLAAVTAFAAPVLAQEPAGHLVSPDQAQAHLLAAGAERAADLARLDDFIGSELGTTALSQIGLDATKARSLAAALGDQELAELAARVAALDTDPVSGQFENRSWVWWGLVVAGAVVLIVLIT